MKTYRYEMNGTGASGQTWTTTGEIEIEPRDFAIISSIVLVQSFRKLTQGKAVFGQPGVGCDGPYTVISFKVELCT